MKVVFPEEAVVVDEIEGHFGTAIGYEVVVKLDGVRVLVDDRGQHKTREAAERRCRQVREALRRSSVNESAVKKAMRFVDTANERLNRAYSLKREIMAPSSNPHDTEVAIKGARNALREALAALDGQAFRPD